MAPEGICCEAAMMPDAAVIVELSGETHPFCAAVPVAHDKTPPLAVIVVLSTSTMPKIEELPFCIKGEASDRMKVVATPLTAAGPAVAVGLAPELPLGVEKTPVPFKN